MKTKSDMERKRPSGSKNVSRTLGIGFLSLVLILGISLPVAAATVGDVKTVRIAVATTQIQIMAKMENSRLVMAEVRIALIGHITAMKKLSPDEFGALQARLQELKSRKDAVATERDYFISQMAIFRQDMLAKNFDGALAILTGIQSHQTTWISALDTFISDAKSLESDIKALAAQDGPIWAAQKAARQAFLASVKEKKATLDATHGIIVQKNQMLKDLLSQIRVKVQAGALDGLSTTDRDWIRTQLEVIHSGVNAMFDGSVDAKLAEFRTNRLAGDYSGALSALDDAISIQATRPDGLDSFIAQAQSILDKLASATPTAGASSSDSPSGV